MRCTPTSAVAKSNKVLDDFAPHSRVTPLPVSKISSSWWSLKRVCCAIVDTRAPREVRPCTPPATAHRSVCARIAERDPTSSSAPRKTAESAPYPPPCHSRRWPVVRAAPHLLPPRCAVAACAISTTTRFTLRSFLPAPPSYYRVNLNFFGRAHTFMPPVWDRVSVCNAVVTRRRQDVTGRPWRWSPAPGASR